MLRVVAVSWSESGAEAPARGNFDRRLDGDFFDWRIGGVEEELFPFEDGEFLADACGDDAVEVRVERGYACGNRNVELIEIFIIAAPREDFAVGGEDDAGDLVDGAGGAMVAGDPLGKYQRHCARFGGNAQVRVIDVSRRVGEVHVKLNGLSENYTL
jgi:hypothetical protein